MYFKSSLENTNIDDEFDKKRKFNTNYKKNKGKILGALILIVLLLVVIILVFNGTKKKKVDYFVEILGEDYITIYQGDDYVEPGYRGYDSKGNDLTEQVVVNNKVDSSQIMEYEVIYSLEGVSVKRTVNVIEKPAGATVIYLNGDMTVYLKVGGEYKEAGYKVIDSVDGNLYDKVVVSGSVDVNKAGVYKIIYTVTNNGGVTTSKERVVVVMDSDISLRVDNENSTNKNVTIEVYVMDNSFDYLVLPNGNRVTVKNYTYSVNKNGEYKFIIYDKMGNVTEKSITINNIDKEIPSGSCSGNTGNGVSKIMIDAHDNVGISKYVIDGVSYTNNEITLNKEMSTVNVAIYDMAGNKKDISCNLSKILPSSSSSSSKKEENSCKEVNVTVTTGACWSGKALENDIDFAYYLMGVVYGEQDPSVEDLEEYYEFYKAFVITVRTYSLYRGGISDHSSYLKLRNCSNDQNYCDVEKGCHRYNTQTEFDLCIKNSIRRGEEKNGRFEPIYTASVCANRVTTNSGTGNSNGKPSFTVNNSDWPSYMDQTAVSTHTTNRWKGPASEEKYKKIKELVEDTKGLVLKDKNNKLVRINFIACEKEKTSSTFCGADKAMKLSKGKSALEILQGYSTNYNGVKIECYN